MQHRNPWLAIGGIGAILVLLGSVWVLSGSQEVSATGLVLGVTIPIAVGVGFAALIIRGRRSRRDEQVHRAIGDDDFD